MRFLTSIITYIIDKVNFFRNFKNKRNISTKLNLKINDNREEKIGIMILVYSILCKFKIESSCECIKFEIFIPVNYILIGLMY